MKNNLFAKKISLFVLALVCLYASLTLLRDTVVLSRKHLSGDFVSYFEERIKRIKPFLGNETSISYFFANDYQTAMARNFTPPPPSDDPMGEHSMNVGRGQLVNYALRPLGVYTNLEKYTKLTIIDFFNHPRQAPVNIKLGNFEYVLVQDFGGGLSLYRGK